MTNRDCAHCKGLGTQLVRGTVGGNDPGHLYEASCPYCSGTGKVPTPAIAVLSEIHERIEKATTEAKDIWDILNDLRRDVHDLIMEGYRVVAEEEKR